MSVEFKKCRSHSHLFSSLSTSAVNQWMTDRTAMSLCEQEGGIHKASFSAAWEASPQARKTRCSENSHQVQTNCGCQQHVASVFYMQSFRNEALTKEPFERLKTHIWWSLASLCVSSQPLVCEPHLGLICAATALPNTLWSRCGPKIMILKVNNLKPVWQLAIQHHRC